MTHPPFHTFRYSPRIDRALAFAASKHVAQKRRGTSVPYIVHPVHVAWLLQAYGLDEDTVIAGVLHDVLEDTDCSREELEGEFGARVAETVWSCTEPDKRQEWEARKAAAVERMAGLPGAAKAVSCADKAHNLHTMADAIERGESDVWKRFKRGREEQLDYHRRALAALSQNFDHPIVEELRGALMRVEALVTNGGPAAGGKSRR